MANRTEQLKEWIHSLPEDVGLLKQFVAAAGAPAESRTTAAGALNYIVTQMDLIPDWEAAAGVLDDAMVVRVAIGLCSERDFGDIDADLIAGLGRLGNESETVSELLGSDLYQKLVRYVRDLSRKEVRRRMPSTIVEDAKVRSELYREIDQEVKDHHADLKDGDEVIRKVKSYFSVKLKGL
jgi:uncharacterized membrane protein YkvA (DUF1232 family)